MFIYELPSLLYDEEALTGHSNQGAVMERLTIQNLGPIKQAVVEPMPLTVFIGPQASGKSLLAQLLYFFRNLDELVGEYFRPEIIHRRDAAEWILKEILDDLRGVPFGYFANGVATLEYLDDCSPFSVIDWKLKVTESNRRVSLSEGKNLKKHVNELLRKFHEEPGTTYRNGRIPSSVFLPTERSLYTSMIQKNPGMLYGKDQPYFVRQFATVMQKMMNQFSNRPTAQDKKSARRSRKWVRTLFEMFPTLGNNLMNDRRTRSWDALRRCLKGSAYVPKTGPSMWKWVTDGEVKKIIPIEAISSGQMEAWPYFLVSMMMAEDAVLHCYLEEPETHLHPAAQELIVDDIVRHIYDGYIDDSEITDERIEAANTYSFILTTHSPFLLFKINNYLQRASLPPDVVKKSSGKPLFPLHFDQIAAYNLGNGNVVDICDPKLKLIDTKEFDDVSSAMGREFEEML